MKHIGSLYIFYVNGNNMNYNYFDKIDTEQKIYLNYHIMTVEVYMYVQNYIKMQIFIQIENITDIQNIAVYMRNHIDYNWAKSVKTGTSIPR